jgi:hypothetical protein
LQAIINLALDSHLLREACALAARQGISMSAFLITLLEKAVHGFSSYEQARDRALARLEHGFDLRWTPAKSSDTVHER